MESLIIFSNAKLYGENVLIVQFQNRLQSYYYLIVEIAPIFTKRKASRIDKEGFCQSIFRI
jgi:hypothetical protein